MDFPKRLKTLSRILSLAALMGALALPLGTAVLFVHPTAGGGYLMDAAHNGGLLTPAVPLADRLMALAVQLVPTGFTAFALLSLRALFASYAKGEVFSERAVNALRHVALGLFWATLLGVAAQAPVTALLTLSAPPGHHMITLGLRTADLASLFRAGVFLVMAWVMAEGRRIADENAKFL